MCIALAILGAGALGAVGSGVAGAEAAGATKSATTAGINEQNAILGQQASLNAPYQALATGGGGNTGAIQQYQNLLGLGPQGAAGEQATLAQTPGYQFAKQQGLQATENAATATGMGLSGNTLQALDTFSTGLADSTYQQAVGNAQNAVGIGQASAAGQAANLGAAGSNISGALINQGNTLAGIDANTIAGISKAATGAAGQYATYNTLQGLINQSSVPFNTTGGGSVTADAGGLT